MKNSIETGLSISELYHETPLSKYAYKSVYQQYIAILELFKGDVQRIIPMAEKKSIDSILGKAKTTVTATFAESERKKGGRPQKEVKVLSILIS